MVAAIENTMQWSATAHPSTVVALGTVSSKKQKQLGAALEATGKDEVEVDNDNNMEQLVHHWIGRPPPVIAKVPSTISFYADTSSSTTTDNETSPPSLQPSELSAGSSNLTEDDQDFPWEHHHHQYPTYNYNTYTEEDEVAAVIRTPVAAVTPVARWTDSKYYSNYSYGDHTATTTTAAVGEDCVSKDLQQERERLKAEFAKAIEEEQQKVTEHRQSLAAATVEQPDLSFRAFLRFACNGELFL